ncbi:nicotinamide-nucleotide amidohydrolase family protein [Streptomyces roseoverticillatus]|uniref:CinA family protein n=1 Tax=Streptomyces roseoverticillatus TaxID=66429 RepID=UPI001F2E9D89|nr:nicotinamide-nucleotide amidohydrolase family protein [Streptomyces roseoverticillatus]MCF3105322.1 nicotinamide-nucleotide amidohydrolase family protein [Streptomyces roseoverticillatus]
MSAASDACALTASAVLAALVARGETVAAAESLTGGLVAAGLTAAPGASRAVRGSVTAYATDVKAAVLGVEEELLGERGAVDGAVARQMARGVRTLLGADWGLATTGVAGPDIQDGKAVGTVFVAAAGPGGRTRVRELSLDGDRSRIRSESVRAVLELLLNELTENVGAKDTEHNGGNGCLQP